ncbi:MAG: hypothetical protein QOH88_1546 [Verrucomicrobiota bacterium]|jgi:hypothetical protein
MSWFNRFAICLLLATCLLGGCRKKAVSSPKEEPTPTAAPTTTTPAPAPAARPTKDPIAEEIYAFRLQVRQEYNTRLFDQLEKRAADLRREKAKFRNGAWKLVQFYESFTCRDDEAERRWVQHDEIHQKWIATFPQSITARIAYADFLMSYAWHARGSGFAQEVTAEGGRLFSERAALAQSTLEAARQLPEKDPFWWTVTLRVARALGWSKQEFDRAVEEAKAQEPQFWSYDVSRAESLLPRWYGRPGDWEEYAEQAAARRDGLGAEVYARIVASLRGYYDNIFHETKASWPTTRDGLAQIRKRCPESLDTISETALLAVLAEDRAVAKSMFDQLGDKYLENVWRTPEYFLRCRQWAETPE